jgi:hypothetical protein
MYIMGQLYSDRAFFMKKALFVISIVMAFFAVTVVQFNTRVNAISSDNNVCGESPITPFTYFSNTGRICIDIDCPGGGTCEVNTNPTPTITPTTAPTVTPTSTPSPTTKPNEDTKPNNPTTDNRGGTNVLGATTMASTGVVASVASNILFGLGLAITALAGASYAKKKK